MIWVSCPRPRHRAASPAYASFVPQDMQNATVASAISASHTGHCGNAAVLTGITGTVAGWCAGIIIGDDGDAPMPAAATAGAVAGIRSGFELVAAIVVLTATGCATGVRVSTAVVLRLAAYSGCSRTMSRRGTRPRVARITA